jgi:tetratricopeptide (TPR) repeat protein
LGLVFLGTAHGLSFWWSHAIASLIALQGLKKISQFYVFWLILLICFLCANEPRFSIEYFLLKVGFLGFALGFNWNKNTNTKRKVFLLLISIGLLESFGICFGEKGGFSLWLPVFLALYTDKKLQTKNIIIYILSSIVMFTQLKLSSILALISTIISKFKDKLLLLLIPIFPIIYFLFFDNLRHFFYKSLISRLFIWGACLKGFLNSPIWGQGFGTFAIDIPSFKIIRPIWGSRAGQELAHGHSLWAHYGFELGIIGLVILIVFFYLIFKQARPAFLPLLIISCFDNPLVSPQQFLISGLIFNGLINLQNKNFIQKKIPEKFSNKAQILVILIALGIFTMSIIGHFYYDRDDYNKAIKWDKYNSLYYLMQGSNFLNKNTIVSEFYFSQAVKLSPKIGYFYGYYSASLLANNKLMEAKIAINKAIKYSGPNEYWYLIKAFINLGQNKKDLYEKYMSLAVDLNPNIPILLQNPQLRSPDVIGTDKADVRVSSFYRRGKKLFLPIPYIDITY